MTTDSFKLSPAELQREDYVANVRRGVDAGVMPDLIDIVRVAKANDLLLPMLERVNRYGQQRLRAQMTEEEGNTRGAS